MLPRHLATDEAQLTRLQREARALASLNHPHSATIHALEQDGDVRFLTLELIDGETLAERLRSAAAHRASTSCGHIDRRRTRGSARSRDHPPGAEAGQRDDYRAGLSDRTAVRKAALPSATLGRLNIRCPEARNLGGAPRSSRTSTYSPSMDATAKRDPCRVVLRLKTTLPPGNHAGVSSISSAPSRSASVSARAAPGRRRLRRPTAHPVPRTRCCRSPRTISGHCAPLATCNKNAERRATGPSPPRCLDQAAAAC